MCNYILVLIFIQEILKSVRWIDETLGGGDAWRLGCLEAWRLEGGDAWRLGCLEAWRLEGYEAWKLFKLIEYMGFIKLIGLNSLEVGLFARKFKVKGEKGRVKDARYKAQGVRELNG